MRDTIRLGRIAGVKLGLHWSLIAIVGLVAVELADNRFSYDAPGHSTTAYTIAGCLTALGLIFGVLLHELGHAVVAKRFGMGVDGITLSWMGGVTRIQGEATRPGSEFMIAGVGPFVSALFGGLLWVLRVGMHGDTDNLLVASISWLAAINIVLAVFNLIPAAPLDGGRIAHSIIWAVTRDKWKATRFAAATGVGLGAVILVAGLVFTAHGHGPGGSLFEGNVVNGLFIGILGWWIIASARTELGVGAVHRALDGLTMADIMRPIGAAPGWMTVRAFAEQYAGPRPGWVWLLEGWNGGYEGVLSGDSLGTVPFPQWDMVRPIDMALPISATTGAAPGEDVIDVLARTSGAEIVVVVQNDRSLGAVLPMDVDALVRMAGRNGPLPRRAPAPESAQ